jgi:hypothetical protein
MKQDPLVHELIWNLIGVVVFFGFVIGGKRMVQDRSYILTFEISVFAYGGAAELLTRVFRSDPHLAPVWPSYDSFFTDPIIERPQAVAIYVILTFGLLFSAIYFDRHLLKEDKSIPRTKTSLIVCCLAMGGFLVTKSCFDHPPHTTKVTSNPIKGTSNTPLKSAIPTS